MPFSRDLPIPGIEVTSPAAPALVVRLAPLHGHISSILWSSAVLAVKRESSKRILEELVLGKAHGQD